MICTILLKCRKVIERAQKITALNLKHQFYVLLHTSCKGASRLFRTRPLFKCRKVIERAQFETNSFDSL